MKLFRNLTALSLALLLLLAAVACGKGDTDTPDTTTVAPGEESTSEPALDYTTTAPMTQAPGTQAPSQSGDDTTTESNTGNGTDTPPESNPGSSTEAPGNETENTPDTTTPVINETIKALSALELVKHSAASVEGLSRYETAMTEQFTILSGPSNYSYRTTAKRILDCDDDAFMSDASLFRYFSTQLTTEQYGSDPAMHMLNELTILNNTVWSASGTSSTPWKSKFALDPTRYDPIQLSRQNLTTVDLSLYFDTLVKADLPDGTYTISFGNMKADQAQSFLSSFHDALESGIRLPAEAVFTVNAVEGIATYDVNGILTRVEYTATFAVPYQNGVLAISASSVRTYNFSGTVTSVTKPENDDEYLEEVETEPLEGIRMYSAEKGESVTLTKGEEAILTELFAELTWPNQTLDDYFTAYLIETATGNYAITDEGGLVLDATGQYFPPTEENQPVLNTIMEIAERHFPAETMGD